MTAKSRALESTSICQLWADRHVSENQKPLWRLLRQFQSPRDFANEFGFQLDTIWKTRRQSGSLGDQAIKFALEAQLGKTCEAVLLLPSARELRRPRATVCVSSQPGCGVGCPFCATGKLGYRGNLSSREICEQVYWAGIEATRLNRHVRNVVFMGMGEPLHNTDAVLDSIHCLTEDRGFGLSPRRITVSTVGVPKQMIRLARTQPGVRIALSLHSAIPEQRRSLVPRAVGDLEKLKSTISNVNLIQAGQPVWLEVVLLSGVNDTPENRLALEAFCEGINVEVNLIPYNSIEGTTGFEPTSKEIRERFASGLRAKGIRTTIRSSFGDAQSAACGQLAGR